MISPLLLGKNYRFHQGGFEYKKAIVDTIISIIEENPEAKEAGLAHLCEFIEDCEHTGNKTEGANFAHAPTRHTSYVVSYVQLFAEFIVVPGFP